MPSPNFRIGHGFDIHKLGEGIPLILGGMKVPHTKGSVGHSDGDVVTHAVIDALLGAAGMGDIGTHFPPTNESIKGIDSIQMLTKIMELLTAEGYSVGNIDTTIVLEKPKLSPHYPGMRKRLAQVLRVEENQIGLKAKTYEKMGEIGEGNAIAAYAVALIYK